MDRDVCMVDVAGETLRQVLRERGPFSLDAASTVLARLALIVDDLHHRGIRHGEIWPENVCLLPDGQVTLEGGRRGVSAPPAGYGAPERVRGLPALFATDIWLMGALLYEMITGVPLPGSGQLYARTVDRTGIQLPPLPEAAACARPVLERALSAAPSDRYACAEIMLEELSLICLLHPEPAAAARAVAPKMPLEGNAAAAATTVIAALPPLDPPEPLGVSLRRHLQTTGPLPVTDACAVLRQIADAVDQLHRRGERHGAILPENIWFLPDGRAHLYHPAGGAPGAAAVAAQGAYLSPEEARGEPATFLTDIWALGALLYEMLAGKSPRHGAQTISGAQGAVRVTLEPLPPASRCAERVLRRSLAWSATDRYPSAGAMAGALVKAVRLRYTGVISEQHADGHGAADGADDDDVSGLTLRRWLDERGPLSLAQVYTLMGEVAKNVEQAHRRGTVYGAVLPDHVWMLPDGTVRVFGAAVADGERLRERQRAAGYLSPEEAEGAPACRASDVWAMGVLLHEAMTGGPPVVAGSNGSGEPVVIDPAAAYAEPVLRRALAARPADRYPSVVAMINELWALLPAGAGPAVHMSVPVGTVP